MSQLNTDVNLTQQSFSHHLSFADSDSSCTTQQVDDSSNGSDFISVIHWFRRGLRFHDNPALVESLRVCHNFRCIYIIDTNTIDTETDVEVNKWRSVLLSFLLLYICPSRLSIYSNIYSSLIELYKLISEYFASV